MVFLLQMAEQFMVYVSSLVPTLETAELRDDTDDLGVAYESLESCRLLAHVRATMVQHAVSQLTPGVCVLGRGLLLHAQELIVCSLCY